MPPESVPTDNLMDFLAICRERIERQLEDLLHNQSPDSAVLHEAMAYAVLNGGKRLRPVLVYGAALACGANLASADRPACAVELMHCYSLVHDDLPAMDNDDLRRGKPTVHRAYNEAIAILVGDALQALAFQYLALPVAEPAGAQQTLRMVQSLARAAGSAGMVAGQAQDFEAVGKGLSRDALESMHGLKTGALITASVEMGALCAGEVSAPALAGLRDYARHIGLAFQVQDDILDETGDTATLGKPRGSDAAQLKPTYVSLLGLDAARKEAVRLSRAAEADLTCFGATADPLRQLAGYIVDRVH